MNIRTIIADGSTPSRRRLKTLLDNTEIEIVGEASSGIEAVSIIGNTRADLVFLDIEMPEMNGFDVIERVGVGKMPITIIMTANEEFAVEAFEKNAADYLLKPLDKERLSRSLDHVKVQMLPRVEPEEVAEKLNRALSEVKPASPRYLKRLTVRNRDRTVVVPIESIDWIASAGNYVEIHAGGETHIVRDSLFGLESRLDPERFVRIHRSRIVNVERVGSLRPLSNGDQIVALNDGTELNLSRTYHQNLMLAVAG